MKQLTAGCGKSGVRTAAGTIDFLGELQMSADEKTQQWNILKTDDSKKQAPQFLIDASAAINAGEAERAIDILTGGIEKDKFAACSGLGQLYLSLAEYEKALEYLQKAMDCNIGSMAVLVDMARALAGLGHHTEAADDLCNVLKCQDNIRDVCILAEGLVGIGAADRAVELLEKIVEKNPDRIDAVFEFAKALEMDNKLEAAKEQHERILQSGAHVQVYDRLINICKGLGYLSEQEHYIKRAMELQPENVHFWTKLAFLLIRTERKQRGIELLRKAVEKEPHNPMIGSNYLGFSHYMPNIDQRTIFEEHKKWGLVHAPVRLAKTSHSNDPDPHRRLRVGYISPDFRFHAVMFFFESLLDAHDGRQVEVYGYSSSKYVDETTGRIRRKFDHYRDILYQSDQAVINLIKKDKIDILIDLAGHTTYNRLGVFTRKPAPVQVTYLGHPNTTGMQQIDYRFTDNLADMFESQKFYTENLVFLPGGFLCYRPPEDAPDVAPLPAEKNGFVTFGSFNNNRKLNPFVISMWAQILKNNDNSRFILKWAGRSDKSLRDRYREIFEQFGIPPHRVQVAEAQRTFPEHLQLYGQVDIALDTYPYNGTTTTCEALYMGVPVVSLVGKCHISRVGLSILTRLGLGFLAASTPEEYIAKAGALAGRVQELAKIRAAMRRRMAASTLCNAKLYAGDIEKAYRMMWQRWCQQQTSGEGETVCKTAAPDKPVVCAAEASPATDTCAQPQEQQTKEKPVVRIIHNLARCGGTLVSRCVGSMKDIILLSEMHPLGGKCLKYLDPIKQAHEWHGLFSSEELAAIREKRLNFAEIIGLVHAKSAAAHKALVLRDWAHLDFMAVPFLPEAGYKLGLADALKDDFKLLQIALVRHPVDQWLSLTKLAVAHGKLSLAAYLRGYLKFAQYCSQTGFIRYEDFTAEPLWQMKILCEKLQLKYDESFLQKWYDYKYVTGDTGRQSRGSKLREIKSLPRPAVDEELLRQFRENDDYWKSLRLLDYSDAAEKKAVPASFGLKSARAARKKKSTAKGKKHKLNASRIIISSMPRSGSMWAYNVTRALIESAAMEVEPGEVPSETAPFIIKAVKEPVSDNKVFCLKTHHVLAEGLEDTLIITTYRDIRDVLLSHMRFMRVDFEQALEGVKEWTRTTDVYFQRKSSNILKIRYSEITSSPLNVIRRIDHFIGTKASFEDIAQINQRFSKKNVKKAIEQFEAIPADQIKANTAAFELLKKPGDNCYRVFDKATGFQTGHISSEKDGEWRQVLTEAQQQRLTAKTADWLEKYGFTR